MASLAIFIDGGYVDRVFAGSSGRVRVDLDRLGERVRRMVEDDSIGDVDRLRTYYYVCPPYQDHPATPEQRERTAGYDRFKLAAQQLRRFEVREGRLERRGVGPDGRPVFQQKRVDLLLGLDIALLSIRQRVTHMALLAGDSDFLPAVTVAKQEGVSFWLFHGPRRTYSQELWNEADERFEMDAEFVNSIRRA